MATSLNGVKVSGKRERFPVTASNNLDPYSLADQMAGENPQSVEVATWHLADGDLVEVMGLAKATRQTSGLNYRLNVNIDNPSVLHRQSPFAILMTTNVELEEAKTSGVLECDLTDFVESPEELLRMADEWSDDPTTGAIALFTLNFPHINLTFALSSTVSVSRKVTKHFRDEAEVIQEVIDDNSLARGGLTSKVRKQLAEGLGSVVKELSNIADELERREKEDEEFADDEVIGLANDDYLSYEDENRIIAITKDGLAMRDNGDVLPLTLAGDDEPKPLHEAARIRRAELAVITPDLFAVDGRLVAGQGVGV